ncbi:hypothetical protein Bca4012_028028 [Brassica carinata]
MMKRICDLPPELVGAKILSKEAAKARQPQFLGFVTVDFKVCSLRFRKEEEAVDLCIKQVGLLNQYEGRKVFHCDGLLLCVLKEDDKWKLLAWNPYLGQTRSISPRTGDDFEALDTYLFGYDMNRNHKILRFHGLVFEMYEFSSNSWRVLDVTLPATSERSKFMNVDTRPLIGYRYVRSDEYFASFFIIGDDEAEEEEKVAVVFDMEGYEFCSELVRTDHYHTAFRSSETIKL